MEVSTWVRKYVFQCFFRKHHTFYMHEDPQPIMKGLRFGFYSTSSRGAFGFRRGCDMIGLMISRTIIIMGRTDRREARMEAPKNEIHLEGSWLGWRCGWRGNITKIQPVSRPSTYPIFISSSMVSSPAFPQGTNRTRRPVCI